MVFGLVQTSSWVDKAIVVLLAATGIAAAHITAITEDLASIGFRVTHVRLRVVIKCTVAVGVERIAEVHAG